MKKTERLEVYEAIFDFSLNGIEKSLIGNSSIVFGLIKPQLVVNKQRFKNGKRGGRSKTETIPNSNQNKTKEESKQNQTETKDEPNYNYNLNSNSNLNNNQNLNSQESVESVEDGKDFDSKKFFRIGARVIQENPSEYFIRTHPIVFEQVIMANMASERKEHIISLYDKKYLYTQFDDSDHMIRAMKKIVELSGFGLKNGQQKNTEKQPINWEGK